MIDNSSKRQDNLVSIILPTYNGSQYLQQSINSCLLQTYHNIELIIVDDCSTDDTFKIINNIKDPRIHLIRHNRNLGLPESLNTGFSYSTGDYLTWTSDDNIFLLNAIERMLDFLGNYPHVDMVYSNYSIINDLGNLIGKFRVKESDSLIDYDCVGACFLYRRILYEKIGQYDPLMKPAEDYDYWLRAAKEFVLAPLDEYLYLYRHHPDSITGEIGQFAAARMGEKSKLNNLWIDSNRYKKAMAYLDICEAFECYQNENYAYVPRLVIDGITTDFRYSFNRGVWSILLRSCWRMYSKRWITNA